MTKERLLPILAVLLVLAEFAFGGILLLRVARHRERFPQPITETPVGYEATDFSLPMAPFGLLMPVLALTALLAIRSHPSIERDPHRRFSPWMPMSTALGGLAFLPLFIWPQESELVFWLVVFLLSVILPPLALVRRESPTPPHLLPWECPDCRKWNAADHDSCRGCSAPRPPEARASS